MKVSTWKGKMFWVIGCPSSASRVCSSNSSIAACPAPLAAWTFHAPRQIRATEKQAKIGHLPSCQVKGHMKKNHICPLVKSGLSCQIRATAKRAKTGDLLSCQVRTTAPNWTPAELPSQTSVPHQNHQMFGARRSIYDPAKSVHRA